MLVALAPERRTVGASGHAPYHRRRAARLSAAEREAVRGAADIGRSLRDLATDFGVGHETVWLGGEPGAFLAPSTPPRRLGWTHERIVAEIAERPRAALLSFGADSDKLLARFDGKLSRS